MEIEQIIRETLMLNDETTIVNSTGPGDFKAWDSLGHIRIISAVEEEYDIELTPEEIMNIRNVEDIRKIISEKSK